MHFPELDKVVARPLCISKTKKGKPCKNSVSHPGERCMKCFIELASGSASTQIPLLCETFVPTEARNIILKVGALPVLAQLAKRLDLTENEEQVLLSKKNQLIDFSLVHNPSISEKTLQTLRQRDDPLIVEAILIKEGRNEAR